MVMAYWMTGRKGNQNAITEIYSGTHTIFATICSGTLTVKDGKTFKPKFRCEKDGINPATNDSFLLRLLIFLLLTKTSWWLKWLTFNIIISKPTSNHNVKTYMT